MTAALLFGVVTPTFVLGYLLWRHEIVLGVCTMGVYLLEVAAQLMSETAYVRKGLCLIILVLLHLLNLHLHRTARCLCTVYVLSIKHMCIAPLVELPHDTSHPRPLLREMHAHVVCRLQQPA